MKSQFVPNKNEFKIMEDIKNGKDKPVLMLNLNKYVAEVDYPSGEVYKSYMEALNKLVKQVEGNVLWQIPVLGQPIGEQDIDEILAIWYPTHRAFLELKNQKISAMNFNLRDACIKHAVIHRCPDNMIPKQKKARQNEKDRKLKIS